MIRRFCGRGRSKLPTYIFVAVLFCIAVYVLRSGKKSQIHSKSLDPYSEDSNMKFRQERYLRYQNRGKVNGPGEYGGAVKLTAEEQKEANRIFDKEAFNLIASDKVALDRSIRDTRDPA